MTYLSVKMVLRNAAQTTLEKLSENSVVTVLWFLMLSCDTRFFELMMWFRSGVLDVEKHSPRHSVPQDAEHALTADSPPQIIIQKMKSSSRRRSMNEPEIISLKNSSVFTIEVFRREDLFPRLSSVRATPVSLISFLSLTSPRVLLKLM